MKRRLHLVFGGELVDTSHNNFKDLDAVGIAGLIPDYRSAYDAWKEASQRAVDSALSRHFIARFSRLVEENKHNSATEKRGS